MPRSAISKRPFLEAMALVNAPLTCPNSVDSSRVRRHGAGIHRNKRPVAARRIQMDGFGDQFFAGATLSLQQHGGAAGRDLRHQVENLQHGLALAHDVLKVVALLQRALELNIFFFRAMAGHCGANVGQQFFIVPGLLDEIRRARLHRLDGIFNRAVGGNHDHRELRIMGANFSQQVDAVAIRQRQVEQHQIERAFSRCASALFAAWRPIRLRSLPSRAGFRSDSRIAASSSMISTEPAGKRLRSVMARR